MRLAAQVNNQLFTQPATLTKATSTLFTYPYSAPTVSVLLPNPEFGNTDNFETNGIARHTRAGGLKTFKSDNWPITQILRMTFKSVDDAVVPFLREFLLACAGKEVGYLDHHSRQWRGVISTPSIATDDDGINCQNDFTFDFIGRIA